MEGSFHNWPGGRGSVTNAEVPRLVSAWKLLLLDHWGLWGEILSRQQCLWASSLGFYLHAAFRLTNIATRFNQLCHLHPFARAHHRKTCHLILPIHSRGTLGEGYRLRPRDFQQAIWVRTGEVEGPFPLLHVCMYTCVYVHMCVYIYIHVHMYIYIYTGNCWLQ